MDLVHVTLKDIVRDRSMNFNFNFVFGCLIELYSMRGARSVTV